MRLRALPCAGTGLGPGTPAPAPLEEENKFIIHPRKKATAHSGTRRCLAVLLHGSGRSWDRDPDVDCPDGEKHPTAPGWAEPGEIRALQPGKRTIRRLQNSN